MRIKQPLSLRTKYSELVGALQSIQAMQKPKLLLSWNYVLPRNIRKCNCNCGCIPGHHTSKCPKGIPFARVDPRRLSVCLPVDSNKETWRDEFEAVRVARLVEIEKHAQDHPTCTAHGDVDESRFRLSRPVEPIRLALDRLPEDLRSTCGWLEDTSGQQS